MDEEFKERLKSLGKQNAKRRTPKYRSLLAHWAMRAIRPPARAQPAPLPVPEANQVAISFAGHATVLVRYHNLSILCDPHLSDWRGAIRREVCAGIAPAELNDVELILLSNPEPDHLDPSTLALLPRNSTIILPPGCAQHVSAFGFARVIELATGQNVKHKNVEICAIATKTSKASPSMAYIIDGNGPNVFFCGAGGYFPGFSKIGRVFKPDIAILPISGYSPKSFRKSHMSPLDALYAFEDLGAKIMIPIRFGSFALSYEKLGDPLTWLRALVLEKDLEEYVVPIENGQSRVFIRPEDTAIVQERTDEERSVDIEIGGLEEPINENKQETLAEQKATLGPEQEKTVVAPPPDEKAFLDELEKTVIGISPCKKKPEEQGILAEQEITVISKAHEEIELLDELEKTVVNAPIEKQDIREQVLGEQEKTVVNASLEGNIPQEKQELEELETTVIGVLPEKKIQKETLEELDKTALVEKIVIDVPLIDKGSREQELLLEQEKIVIDTP